MTDLSKLTIASARDALRKGDVSSAELTNAYLGAIEGAGALNALSAAGRKENDTAVRKIAAVKIVVLSERQLTQPRSVQIHLVHMIKRILRDIRFVQFVRFARLGNLF